MFELRREGAIAGDGGPAVVEQLHVRTADVDHWLHREEHAGAELWAGAGPARVDDLRAVVEEAADAMTTEVADDGVAVAFGVALDRRRNVAQPVAGPCLLDADHEALV